MHQDESRFEIPIHVPERTSMVMALVVDII